MAAYAPGPFVAAFLGVPNIPTFLFGMTASPWHALAFIHHHSICQLSSDGGNTIFEAQGGGKYHAP